MKWTAIVYAYGDYQQLGTYRGLDDAKTAIEYHIGKKMRAKRISKDEYELDGRHLAITMDTAKRAGYENLKEARQPKKTDVMWALKKENSLIPYKVYEFNGRQLHLGADASQEPQAIIWDLEVAFKGMRFEYEGKVRGSRNGEHVYKFNIMKECEMRLNEYSSGFDAIDLTSKDMKVIDSFLAQKKAKSDNLTTDGTYLTANWRGSQAKAMAYWLQDGESIGMAHITGKETDDAYHSVMDVVRKEIKRKHVKLSEGKSKKGTLLTELKHMWRLATVQEAEKKLTLKDVNAAIKKMGYELIKGHGYFYFMPLGNHDMLDNESVYIYRVDGYSLDQWVKELEDKIKESR